MLGPACPLMFPRLAAYLALVQHPLMPQKLTRKERPFKHVTEVTYAWVRICDLGVGPFKRGACLAAKLKVRLL